MGLYGFARHIWVPCHGLNENWWFSKWKGRFKRQLKYLIRSGVKLMTAWGSRAMVYSPKKPTWTDEEVLRSLSCMRLFYHRHGVNGQMVFLSDFAGSHGRSSPLLSLDWSIVGKSGRLIIDFMRLTWHWVDYSIAIDEMFNWRPSVSKSRYWRRKRTCVCSGGTKNR